MHLCFFFGGGLTAVVFLFCGKKTSGWQDTSPASIRTSHPQGDGQLRKEGKGFQGGAAELELGNELNLKSCENLKKKRGLKKTSQCFWKPK